jgi:protein ImuB
MTRIVSVWLPAWPIERLKRQSPGVVPEGRPFALVESGAHGIRIVAANERALANSVRIGVSLPDARAVLPALLARPAQPDLDRTALFALARWCGRYGPSRHVHGDDGIWIDITGVAHLFGGEEELLADLVRRCAAFGITARAGLADTLGAAFALARFATGHTPFVIAAPGEASRALADLPVSGLRIENDTVRLLQRLGLKRIGQLYDLPRAALERRFRVLKAKGARKTGMAAAVLARLDQALGRTAEPCTALVEPARFVARLAFPEPLISAAGVENAVARLAGELCRHLAAAGFGARRLRLALNRADGTRAEVRIGTSTPCRDPRHIETLLLEKIQALDAGFGIDEILLAATFVEKLFEQQTSFGQGDPRSLIGAEMLIDKLSNRLGRDRVMRFSVVVSYMPERAQSLKPALLCPAEMFPVRAATHRPPFLLSPPEPVTVLAEVPEGAPALMTWRKLERRIVHAQGPERIASEWWRMIAEPIPANDRSQTRDYYRLEDATGARYWVFRQGFYGEAEDEAPRWYMHGLFA